MNKSVVSTFEPITLPIEHILNQILITIFCFFIPEEVIKNKINSIFNVN